MRNNHFLDKWSEMNNHKWKDSNQWEDNSILTKWEDNNLVKLEENWRDNSHLTKWRDKCHQVKWKDNKLLTKWKDNIKWVEDNNHQVKWKEKINYLIAQWNNKDHNQELIRICNTKDNQLPQMNIKLIKLEQLLKRHFLRTFQNQLQLMPKRLPKNQSQLLLIKTKRKQIRYPKRIRMSRLSNLKINLLSVVQMDNFIPIQIWMVLMMTCVR